MDQRLDKFLETHYPHLSDDDGPEKTVLTPPGEFSGMRRQGLPL
jgi:hypothetical protein